MIKIALKEASYLKQFNISFNRGKNIASHSFFLFKIQLFLMRKKAIKPLLTSPLERLVAGGEECPVLCLQQSLREEPSLVPNKSGEAGQAVAGAGTLLLTR